MFLWWYNDWIPLFYTIISIEFIVPIPDKLTDNGNGNDEKEKSNKSE